ncbi:MAG TPA: NADP-dependent oxidoreductase, partial [Paraburkholderia sp.]
MTDDIDETMQAWRIERFGGPDALRKVTLPTPHPARGEVLVEVRSAGVNPVDVKTREGRYPMIREDALPFTLGRDVAGIVARCGEGVERWQPGQQVFAFVGQGPGAYAEYVSVDAHALASPPSTLSLEDAGAVPLAALTAWQGLFDHGKLERGERVLIHGASGGVGQFAVQFAREAGAHVLATGSGESLDQLKTLGANETIDYKTQRFEDVAPNIDLVYDLIGGDTQQRSWAVIKQGGALISTLTEPSQIEASKHGARAARYTARPDGDQLRRIVELFESGA